MELLLRFVHNGTANGELMNTVRALIARIPEEAGIRQQFHLLRQRRRHHPRLRFERRDRGALGLPRLAQILPRPANIAT